MKEVTMRYFTSGEELEAFLKEKIEQAEKLNLIKPKSVEADDSIEQESTTSQASDAHISKNAQGR